MGLSVIGAGFGRTGTYSLKHALEMLGLGPCYHMAEAYEHPEHAAHWSAGLHGESVDWTTLLEGYQAAVDWPAAYFWLDFLHEFPNSKVILTVRDPQAWYRSMSNTILATLKQSDDVDEADDTGRLARDLLVNYVFPEGVEDEASVIAQYQRNVESVCQTVPAGRLLVFDVAEGWAPLCEFLEVDVPSSPFPNRNDTNDFREWSNMEPLA